MDLLEQLQQVLKKIEAFPVSGNEIVLEHPFLSSFLQHSQFRDEVVIVQTIGDMRYHYVSQNAETILGYTSKEVLDGGVPMLFQLMEPDDAKHFVAAIDEIAQYMQQHHQQLSSPLRLGAHYQLRLPNQTYQWISHVSYTFASEPHQPISKALITLKPIQTPPPLESRYQFSHWLSEEKWETVHTYQPIAKWPDLPISRRELTVLREVSLGYSSREAAQRLKLSRFTVDTHLKNIRAKLNCRTTAEAVAKMAQYFNSMPEKPDKPRASNKRK